MVRSSFVARHFSRFLVAACLACTCAIAGCATASTLSEAKPLPAGVVAYKSFGIRMKPGAKEDDGGKYSVKFAQHLASKLNDQKLFAQVVTDPSKPADLVVTLAFTRIDRPGGVASVLASSAANAEVELDGVFTKGESPDPIGNFHLTGNSKNRGRASVGGFGVTSSEDYTETAIEEAAEKLAELIVARR